MWLGLAIALFLISSGSVPALGQVAVPDEHRVAPRLQDDPDPNLPGVYIFDVQPMSPEASARFLRAREEQLRTDPPRRVAPLPEQRVTPRERAGRN
ncbi:MAG: hypothetical protein AB7N54_08620 [Alphaproteobacteria bacterium]